VAGLDAHSGEGTNSKLSTLSTQPEAIRRLSNVGGLLRLLESGGPTLHPGLVDITYARVIREGPTLAQQAEVSTIDELMRGSLDRPLDRSLDGLAAERDIQLCEADEDALEALVMSGFDPSRVTSSLRPRAANLQNLGDLIAQSPAQLTGGQLLIERTFAQVIQTQRVTPFEPVSSRRGSLAWADIISVAAVLLIGVSAVWPVLSTYRAHASRQACMGNLANVASAFGSYANDFRGSMPMATASLGGLPWWNVGKDPAQSNSANLFTLARKNYAGLEQLACNGNALCSRQVADDAMDWPALPNVSYSYFVMFGRARPAFGAPRMDADFAAPAKTVVLADASPVIRRAITGQRVFPMENSANHGGEGQTALRLDGSALWLNTPNHEGDNIWLPADVEEVLREVQQQMSQGQKRGEVPLLTRQDAAQQRAIRLLGTESPKSLTDAFVGP